MVQGSELSCFNTCCPFVPASHAFFWKTHTHTHTHLRPPIPANRDHRARPNRFAIETSDQRRALWANALLYQSTMPFQELGVFAHDSVVVARLQNGELCILGRGKVFHRLCAWVRVRIFFFAHAWHVNVCMRRCVVVVVMALTLCLPISKRDQRRGTRPYRGAHQGAPAAQESGEAAVCGARKATSCRRSRASWRRPRST